MELTPRQIDILKLVQRHAPITGEQIAEQLGLARPTIRSDLAVLVMLGHLEAKPKVGYTMGKTTGDSHSVSHRLLELKVGDVKARPVIIRETATVHDAIITLFLENVGGLVVADEDNYLQGVLSRRDLLKATLGNPNPAATPVGVAMTRKSNIVTVTCEDSLLEAGRRMIRHEVHSLPVVQAVKGRDGKEHLEVVGRISKTTLLQAILDSVQSEALGDSI